MRIDEFSIASDIDGKLDRKELTRFLLVGFDGHIPYDDLTLYTLVSAETVLTPVVQSARKV